MLSQVKQKPRRKKENRIEIKKKYRPTKGLDKWLHDTPVSSITPEYLEKLKVLPPVISQVERIGIFKIYVI